MSRLTAAALLLCAWMSAFAGGDALLPYQLPDRHLGVASCASSVCHGSVTANPNYPVRLDEFVTWSHEDAHARAYAALSSERSRSIAAKLGLESAASAPLCLACHADDVAPARRGPRFALSDGVGCETCHGGGERWIASHASATSTYQDEVRHGMYPTANLIERAALCASCHVGNADKLAAHRLMGAGHPRLSFELDTFLAMEPPHYTLDAKYRRRKQVFIHSQIWAVGQLQASVSQLGLLQDPSIMGRGMFPELALFNCSSCHDSSMQRPEWRRRAMTELVAPGTVSLNDANWRMSWIIARAIDAADGARVLRLAQALQKSVMSDREQIEAPARELATLLRRLQTLIAREDWTATRASDLLRATLDAGADGEFRDYLGAEQAVMVIELLLIDDGRAGRVRDHLDELYRIVRDDQSFRSADLVASIRALRSVL